MAALVRALTPKGAQVFERPTQTMMIFATLRRAFTTLAVLGAVGACDSPTEVCTLIGCDSGLTVQLSSLPVGDFTVEVLPDYPTANPPVYRIDCTGGVTPCSSRLFFPGLFIARPSVRVTTSLGTRTSDPTEVTYVTSYPNGRQCSPTCRQGTVIVGIPE